MKICKTAKSLRSEISQAKKSKKIISFVPTMGAIHHGHLSLIFGAKKKSDIVIASIFVNEKQFNNQEDFKNYPKTLSLDIEKFKQAGVDILFIPTTKEIYPNDCSLNIDLGEIGKKLCGKYRPGHFNGVALIVLKLFNIVQPDIAIFGQKDFQQLQIIKNLAFDLNIDIQILGGKTVRDKNGLAMSSRNLRLDESSRKIIAPKIYQILSKAKDQILAKENPDLKKILADCKNYLLSNGFEKIDYLEVCNEKNLQEIERFDSQIKSRIFIAVYLNQIRLIDNIKLY